jgi:hypothetical protein
MLEKWRSSSTCKFFKRCLNTSKSHLHIFNASISTVQILNNVSLKVRVELITQSRYPIWRRQPANLPGIHHSISCMHCDFGQVVSEYVNSANQSDESPFHCVLWSFLWFKHIEQPFILQLPFSRHVWLKNIWKNKNNFLPTDPILKFEVTWNKYKKILGLTQLNPCSLCYEEPLVLYITSFFGPFFSVCSKWMQWQK